MMPRERDAIQTEPEVPPGLTEALENAQTDVLFATHKIISAVPTAKAMNEALASSADTIVAADVAGDAAWDWIKGGCSSVVEGTTTKDGRFYPPRFVSHPERVKRNRELYEGLSLLADSIVSLERRMEARAGSAKRMCAICRAAQERAGGEWI